MNQNSENNRLHKRRAMLGAITGAGVASLWHKPIVNSVLLPTHAQTSVFSGQYIDNNVGITLGSLMQKESIIERIAGMIVPVAHAGHESPSGGHVIVDVAAGTFSATVITEDPMDHPQQLEGSGGTVDGAPLRLDVVGGFCDVPEFVNYILLSVSNVGETMADYQLTGFDFEDTQIYSASGVVVTGLTPPAPLTPCAE